MKMVKCNQKKLNVKLIFSAKVSEKELYEAREGAYQNELIKTQAQNPNYIPLKSKGRDKKYRLKI
jgi:hypothetical protein